MFLGQPLDPLGSEGVEGHDEGGAGIVRRDHIVDHAAVAALKALASVSAYSSSRAARVPAVSSAPLRRSCQKNSTAVAGASAEITAVGQARRTSAAPNAIAEAPIAAPV